MSLTFPIWTETGEFDGFTQCAAVNMKRFDIMVPPHLTFTWLFDDKYRSATCRMLQKILIRIHSQKCESRSFSKLNQWNYNFHSLIISFLKILNDFQLDFKDIFTIHGNSRDSIGVLSALVFWEYESHAILRKVGKMSDFHSNILRKFNMKTGTTKKTKSRLNRWSCYHC